MNLDEFQRLIVASQLVDEGKAVAMRSRLRVQTVPAFGRLLIQQGLITAWQCDHLRDGRYKGFFEGKFKLLNDVGANDNRMRFLAEDTSTGKQVILSTERPKSGQPYVYDVEGTVPPQQD